MSSKKSIPILIGIIGLLLVLLAGSIGYIIGNSSVISNGVIPSASVVNDAKVLKQIDELKAMYDAKIAEKTNSYNALEQEKSKVAVLVAALEQSKADAQSLVKYKTQYQALEFKMKILVGEIVVLKNKKSNAVVKSKVAVVKAPIQIVPKIETANTTSIAVVAKKEPTIVKQELVKSKSEDFFVKKELPKNTDYIIKPAPEIKKTIPVVRYEKFAKISLSNVKSSAINLKSDGSQIETNASSKADLIKISFTVDGIANAKPGERVFYIQIINAKNNVVGKRITEYFDSETLTYSLSKTITYNNQSVDCTIDFPYKDFEKGVYFINVFDRNDLIGRSNFTLK